MVNRVRSVAITAVGGAPCSESCTSAFLCVGAEPLGARLRDRDEVGPLGEMKSSTLKPVDHRCARRARLLDKRQLGCLARWGTRS